MTLTHVTRAPRTAALLALLTATAAIAGCGSQNTPNSQTAATRTMAEHPKMGSDPSVSSHTSGMHMSDADGGLAAAESGYRLDLKTTTATTAATSPIRFAIIAPDGKPQTDYATDQTKKLHFYVVRRDLTAYQHIHPVLAPDGTWSIPVQFTAAGPYRVYADFVANDAKGTQHPLVLSQRLNVHGAAYHPAMLPAPTNTTTIDGYTVTLTGIPKASRETPLTVRVTRAAKPVRDLQPYLDTFAHMTALNAKTLAYRHLHPQTPPRSAGHTGPDLRFAAQLPTPGTYKLFLQFKDRGRLHLAQFVVTVT